LTKHFQDDGYEVTSCRNVLPPGSILCPFIVVLNRTITNVLTSNWKSDTINRHTFRLRTFLWNFIPNRFAITEILAFYRWSLQQQ